MAGPGSRHLTEFHLTGESIFGMGAIHYAAQLRELSLTEAAINREGIHF
jgi:hypothetical protein